ncbi:transcription antitermination factor NusB [Boudabousia liubingyangii]|uniref:Transcription antitermination protein NusB n=1 Tax=Boudabousia liubingyangii TaxID=1921764 RepID=A0A1Q5PNJ0_9ACTO|nr:transcription antitermination factor NusB [Boudabousia liubingyangii]OKL47681.1 transcription antitermination factor NusB [Boudabousia liubingyangii]OKL49107.1 transcription antitermination factor NusB [Boudabousia liubingyangii]
MSVRKGSRTKARIRAIDVLFEGDERCGTLTSGDLLRLLEERKQVTAAQTPLPAYAVEIVSGVAANLDSIDRAIATYSNRDWNRMPSVDRSILRVAVWEILFNEDVDGVVAITQAVGIADSLCAPDAPAFINAVLDKVQKSAGKLEGVYLDELDEEDEPDLEKSVSAFYEGEYLDE